MISVLKPVSAKVFKGNNSSILALPRDHFQVHNFQIHQNSFFLTLHP